MLESFFLRVVQTNNETLRGTTLFHMMSDESHGHFEDSNLEYDKHLLPNSQPHDHISKSICEQHYPALQSYLTKKHTQQPIPPPKQKVSSSSSNLNPLLPNLHLSYKNSNIYT
jgi:hypothetical protein